jgi:hypothetical protein
MQSLECMYFVLYVERVCFLALAWEVFLPDTGTELLAESVVAN